MCFPSGPPFCHTKSVDPGEWTVRPERTTLDPPVVLHAPSDPRVKGTESVVAAVSKLQAEGVSLRFELLQGVSREAVRSALERSTIVVDQLNAGWYGTFAVEAMALGKPVVAAMDLLAHPCLPQEFCRDVPVIHASRDTLADQLRSLLDSRDECQRVGSAGRAFVERWHDPRKVARTVVDAYYIDRSTERMVKPAS